MHRLMRAFAILAIFLASCHTAPAASGADVGAYQISARYGGPDGGWDFVTFDPAHRRVYIAGTDGVAAFDVATGTLTPHVVTGSHTHIALPINNGAEILVTDTDSGGAFIADALTGVRRGATIATGAKPDSALLEPLTGLVWVMDNDGGGITLIDPHAGAKVGAIALPGALESPVSDSTGRVFVTVEDLAEIVVVDARKLNVIAHWHLDDCEGPTGLAYDALSRCLVAECANRTAKIVSANTDAVVSSVVIGSRPDELALDATHHLVYAPTAGDGQISIIDPARARVVSTIATQIGCRGAALDQQSGKLYLPAGRFLAPTTPNGRPSLAPGSFEVLVLAR